MQDIDIGGGKTPASNVILFSDYRRLTDKPELKAPTREEERELVQEAQRGNQAAIDRLMAEFDRMVQKRARAYSRGEPKREAGEPDATDYIGTLADDEVIAAGRLGLLEAIARFDPSLPYRFSTIARHYIRGRILSAVKDWAGHGLASDSEADRWLAFHRGATAEEIVAATGCTRESAELAVEREYAAKRFCSYFDQEGAWNFDRPESSISDAGGSVPNPQPRTDMRELYDALNPSHLNPQLNFHGSWADRCSKLVDDLFGKGDLESGQLFLSAKREMLPNVKGRLQPEDRVWRPPLFRLGADGSLTIEERRGESPREQQAPERLAA
jgi:hypothetical protein